MWPGICCRNSIITSILKKRNIYLYFVRQLALQLIDFFFIFRMVIETLKNVNEDRKCFRLVGGVLTERKVKDVLPVLIANQEKLKEFIEKLHDQITKKGQEINEYREKYNIRFRGLDNPKQEDQPVSSGESRGNVLVS